MKELFMEFPVMAWSIVSVMSAVLVLSLMWPKVKWWWHNTWYSFPLIGKIARLSTDPNKDTADPAWFKAEKTLCRDYKKFIRIQDEFDFNEKVNYLTKAGDIGRRATPHWIWAVNAALVVVEAMGFSYVLAGYTLPGASENLQQMGALGIAFMVSVILVAGTHFSGHELYKSGKIKQARQEWIECGRVGKTTTGAVALSKPQSIDDDQPGYVQLMNRVGTTPSYVISICTAIFVAIVAIGATYVRGQVLEKQLHQQITGQSSSAELTITLGKDGLNMKAESTGQRVTLPPEDAAANRRVEEKALADEVSIDRHGGWGTFIVLAFIFVFLQLLGVLFGFKWGFAGMQSSDAYRSIGAGRYGSYADVREHYKEVADTAQSKLEHLQQKLMERNSLSGNDGLHTSRSFYDFMDAERGRETADRENEMQHAAQRGRLETAQRASATPAVQAAAPQETLETALQKLEAMGDNKESKKAFVQSLPGPLQGEILKALKTQKEEAARRASQQRDAELDSLLG